jgi:hypothetical protein
MAPPPQSIGLHDFQLQARRDLNLDASRALFDSSLRAAFLKASPSYSLTIHSLYLPRASIGSAQPHFPYVLHLELPNIEACFASIAR